MSSAASLGNRRGGRRASGGDRSSGSAIRGTGSEAGGATGVASVNNDRDDVAAGGEVSNNGSTTTEGGGGSADEPGMTRKRKRMANRAARGPLQRSVHPTPADSERWFTNTHLAMVMILAEIYTDLEDRHLRSHDEFKEAEDAWEGYMHRIKDVGQEVNAFAKSRVQTHLLISNTVQLCHRMAADKNCHLAKDYPPGDESDFEYDFSTDENTDGEDGEEDDRKVANGGGVSNGKAKKVREIGDGGGGKEGGPSDKCHRGGLRERYDALVVCLVERSRWNAERPGRPHKDVITRAREVMMAIFMDSYYRKMLSREMLDETFGNLERIIALGDAAGDGGEGGTEVKVDLGDGLPLSKIGLANIALTPPE